MADLTTDQLRIGLPNMAKVGAAVTGLWERIGRDPDAMAVLMGTMLLTFSENIEGTPEVRQAFLDKIVETFQDEKLADVARN